MGNNAAFTAYEATVIAAHNKGVLDKELLGSFMEVYRDMDIDSGGMEGTLSKDGLDCVEITLKVMGVDLSPRPKLPKNYKKWTTEQEQQNEDWYEEYWSKFHKITDRFGWG